jgi:hypothetical protein
MKITAPDLPDTLRNALPDRGRDALPALGGPPLRHEYSEAPYKHAITKSSEKTDSE